MQPMFSGPFPLVMAGLKREARLRVHPGHPRLCCGQGVDARDKPGHDALENPDFIRCIMSQTLRSALLRASRRMAASHTLRPSFEMLAPQASQDEVGETWPHSE